MAVAIFGARFPVTCFPLESGATRARAVAAIAHTLVGAFGRFVRLVRVTGHVSPSSSKRTRSVSATPPLPVVVTNTSQVGLAATVAVALLGTRIHHRDT